MCIFSCCLLNNYFVMSLKVILPALLASGASLSVNKTSIMWFLPHQNRGYMDLGRVSLTARKGTSHLFFSRHVNLSSSWNDFVWANFFLLTRVTTRSKISSKLWKTLLFIVLTAINNLLIVVWVSSKVALFLACLRLLICGCDDTGTVRWDQDQRHMSQQSTLQKRRILLLLQHLLKSLPPRRKQRQQWASLQNHTLDTQSPANFYWRS